MSHCSVIKCRILSLEALKRACTKLGLEFVENQDTFKYYGRIVGDYPLPIGYTAKDMGKCVHAIKIPKGHPAWRPDSYEIGVVRSKTHEGYDLLWDFYGGGFGLDKVVGKDAYKLVQEYTAGEAETVLEADGWTVGERQVQPDGTIIIETEEVEVSY